MGSDLDDAVIAGLWLLSRPGSGEVSISGLVLAYDPAMPACCRAEQVRAIITARLTSGEIPELAERSGAPVISTRDGRFAYVSSVAAAVLGRTRAELVSHPYTHFMHPGDVERSCAAAARNRAGGGGPKRYVNRWIGAGGEVRTVRWDCSAIVNGRAVCRCYLLSVEPAEKSDIA